MKHTMKHSKTRSPEEQALLHKLLEVAAQPVPSGLGVVEVGYGVHMYLKTNPNDGSTIIFRFPTWELCQRAMHENFTASLAA
ncbi:MAG: hypothetical protein AAF645_24505 [Myxococcota bacterium]